MKVVLDLTKSLEENASVYYDRAKKARKKMTGARETLHRAQAKLAKQQPKKKVAARPKREWYEKFRWFLSSEDILVLGGRDATSNEVLIKKHTDAHDLVLHTDMAGSPFFVIKTEGKTPIKTIREAADATVTFSRAWKLGLQTTDVFHVMPAQVSKKTKAGEYMGKGAFMIYGKTTYVENQVNLGVGVHEHKVMAGPLAAVEKQCPTVVRLVQGPEKASVVAKKISRTLDCDLDDVLRALPAGTFSIRA